MRHVMPPRAAIQQDPQSARYMNGLGVVLLRAKRYTEAAEVFQKALEVGRRKGTETGREGGDVCTTVLCVASDSPVFCSFFSTFCPCLHLPLLLFCHDEPCLTGINQQAPMQPPQYQSAVDNLAEVRTILAFLREEEDKEARRPEHNMWCPREYTLADLLRAEKKGGETLREKILSRPFVVRGSDRGRRDNRSQRRRQHKLSPVHLQRKYGGARVDYYPYSMTHTKISPFFLTLRDSLEFLSNVSRLASQSARFMVAHDEEHRQMRKNLTGQYVQWNLDAPSWQRLLEDAHFRIPAILDDR